MDMIVCYRDMKGDRDQVYWAVLCKYMLQLEEVLLDSLFLLSRCHIVIQR